MRNIVLDHILDKERDDYDSDHRINEIKPVLSRLAEVGGKENRNLQNQKFQKLGRETAYHTDNQSQNDDEILLLYMAFPPLDDFGPPFGETVMLLFICH